MFWNGLRYLKGSFVLSPSESELVEGVVREVIIFTVFNVAKPHALLIKGVKILGV